MVGRRFPVELPNILAMATGGPSTGVTFSAFWELLGRKDFFRMSGCPTSTCWLGHSLVLQVELNVVVDFQGVLSNRKGFLKENSQTVGLMKSRASCFRRVYLESPDDPNQKWLVITQNNGWSWTHFSRLRRRLQV